MAKINAEVVEVGRQNTSKIINRPERKDAYNMDDTTLEHEG
jgi:hypothetical protein